MTLFLRYAAKSDVGLVRSANEDSGFAGRTLLAVADGMGGHAAGELASSTAIATLAELDSQDMPTEDLLTELTDAILTSAERISQYIEADPSRAGMGTTLTAILWRAGRIAVIHVGDSRAYLLRDGELTQITHDHTYVQSLIDAGRITPEQARRHPKRNLLLRAIDGNQLPEGETSMREAQVGDRYMLCSDGLCGVINDVVIARALSEVADPTAAVTALVDLALEAGAPDNVTVVVADVVEADDAEVVRETREAIPVVVGAAGERRNRAALPGLQFPDDVGPAEEADEEPTPSGPAVAGGLVARGADRGQAEGDGSAPGPATGSVPATSGDEDAGPAQPPGFVRRHLGLIAGLAVTLALLVIGLIGFLWWLSSQWFVGVEAGYVAVYQGVPQQLAGVSLNRVTSQSAVEVTSLPYYYQQQLEKTIEATTQADAGRIVANLEKSAADCRSDNPPTGCPIGAEEAADGILPSPSGSASPAASPDSVTGAGLSASARRGP